MGELVFDAKPYVCYSAVPSKKITISLYDHETEDGAIRYSGTFTAFFRCYDPFGQLRKISWNDDALPGEQAHTGLLPARMMPAPPTAQTRKLLVYNPGTERAHTRIRLTGSVGSGLLIRNFTTGQRCRVVSLEEDSLLPGAV
ncbi:MAG: hypothetical protein Q4E13_00630 [Clostridia bacterium]|nr:hypothetical protein [Clostridia bacterium]